MSTTKKYTRHLLWQLFMLMSLPFPGIAQVEGVLVERYYVSDSLDATDTLGGSLPAGSVTYRVYVDLAPGSRLISLFGSADHPLRFESTADFFNNKADGQSFAKDFAKTRYSDNTVALDSWLTLGQTTRTATKTWFGVPKTYDRDGSFIGGSNNDGGSAGVPGGLITNADPLAGIPVIISDGMDTMAAVPSLWASSGITDPITGDDSTIFGSLRPSRIFDSRDAVLQNSGVTGVNTDSNQVLIAQLTTTGQLSFELNLVVEEPAAPVPLLVRYVASFAPGEVNSDTLRLSPFLKYPPACGCRDPLYLEYSPAYSCGTQDSCRTRIVFGCMDPLACNFDPAANFNVNGLCCYPGYCNDRDIATVCPQLNFGRSRSLPFLIYPNPVSGQIHISCSPGSIASDCSIRVVSVLGTMMYEFTQVQPVGDMLSLDLSGLSSGCYILYISSGGKSETVRFIKQ